MNAHLALAPVVLSFFDYTAIAVRDWAEAGFEVHCFDLQHEGHKVAHVSNGGSIHYRQADLSGTSLDWSAILREFAGRDVRFVFGFPPCTDLANSGSRHWAAKLAADPLMWAKAVAMARMVANVAETLGSPYLVENPVGKLNTLWRKPDHKFDPCEYGGYLPQGENAHPIWPAYIPARDAYTKKTCLWAGNGFVMPEARPVEPISHTLTRADGRKTTGSPQWAKLGGKSLKTKNIRNATPRGFARAVFEANHGQPVQMQLPLAA